MLERVSILQAQFFFCSFYLPEDVLLVCLLSYIRNIRKNQCAVDQSLWTLWSPMSKPERCHCMRWRLGWLPAINCLDMYRHLLMPKTIRDPSSFRLNMLPLRPSVLQNLALTWCDMSRIYKE
ncbi:hypothetical protein BCV72DRAFT_258311 [Rhizopus microsporus var. microsporus]|uniref:Uncharacterized protein n=1 Tax=Rhizopus microsporus var. microsporus TaxID=86635 RepID=A0A1X0QRM1_RHIZD|nr:hypothetical protein BCV72DRAFT_258311 [Rhizopus microsporus var. microsporus]